MSTNGRRIPIPVRHEHSITRLTPEMCRAIRRQESNDGFDYWKAGFSGPGSSSSPTIDRKAGFPNLAQINVTFPGVFLPNVDGVSAKLRRRNSIVGFPPNSAPLLGLRRSNSMISTVPSRRIPIQTVQSTKRSLNSDFTTQLPEPLMSYTNASFPDIGLFRSIPTRYRNVNYPWDDKNLSDAEDVPDGDADDADDANDLPKPAPDYPTVATDDYEEFNEVESIQSPIILSDTDRPSYPVQNGKPYKSILKNSGQSVVSKEHFIPQQIKMPSVCSYQLPSSRPGLVPTVTLYNSSGKVAMDSLRGHPHNGYVYNSLRRQQSAKASSRVVPAEDYDNCDQFTGVVNDVTTRKRCVRFNVAHQIHEYRPHDPIINC